MEKYFFHKKKMHNKMEQISLYTHYILCALFRVSTTLHIVVALHSRMIVCMDKEKGANSIHTDS